MSINSDRSMLIHAYIVNQNYKDALGELEKLQPLQYKQVYKIYNGTHSVNLLLDQDLTDESKRILCKIIEKTPKIFKEIHPLEYTIKNKKLDSAKYLLNEHVKCLKKSDLVKSAYRIARESHVTLSKTLVENLISSNKNITMSPPIMQSINSGSYEVFENYLRYLQNNIFKNQDLLTGLDQTFNIDLLHILAKEFDGAIFLEIFRRQPFPIGKSGTHEEIIKEHINDINLKDKVSPLALALKMNNLSFIARILNLGAKHLVSETSKATELEKIDDDSSNEKELSICKEAFSSKQKNKVFQMRREQYLLRWCKKGEIELATILLNEFGVNHLLVDKKKNSLLMILLNQKIPSNEIIKFIESVGKKKLNLEQINNDTDNALTLAAKLNYTSVKNCLEQLYFNFI